MSENATSSPKPQSPSPSSTTRTPKVGDWIWYRTTQEKDVIGIITFIPQGKGDAVNVTLFMPQGPPLAKEAVQHDKSDSPSTGLWRYKD